MKFVGYEGNREIFPDDFLLYGTCVLQEYGEVKAKFDCHGAARTELFY